MRIGELARRTGLSRDTIRFYERHGLIASLPSREPANNYREYPEETAERLTMIVEARHAGLSVADLEQLIAHIEGGDVSTFSADRFIADKIAEVERVIAHSQRFLDMLRATQAALAGPHDRPSDKPNVRSNDRPDDGRVPTTFEKPHN